MRLWDSSILLGRNWQVYAIHLRCQRTMIFCCCKNPAQIFDFGHPQNTRALDLFSACRYEFDRLPWAAPISTRAISKTKDMVIICSKYPVTPLLPLSAVCTLYPMMRSQKLRDEASPVAIKCCFKDLLPCSSCNWNLSESHTWRIEGEGRTRGGWIENEQIPRLLRMNKFQDFSETVLKYDRY